MRSSTSFSGKARRNVLFANIAAITIHLALVFAQHHPVLVVGVLVGVLVLVTAVLAALDWLFD